MKIVNSPSDCFDPKIIREHNINFMTGGTTKRLLEKYKPKRGHSPIKAVNENHIQKKAA